LRRAYDWILRVCANWRPRMPARLLGSGDAAPGVSGMASLASPSRSPTAADRLFWAPSTGSCACMPIWIMRVQGDLGSRLSSACRRCGSDAYRCSFINGLQLDLVTPHGMMLARSTQRPNRFSRAWLRIVVSGGVGSSRAETLLGFLSQVNVGRSIRAQSYGSKFSSSGSGGKFNVRACRTIRLARRIACFRIQYWIAFKPARD
jgi:hypothetical protein